MKLCNKCKNEYKDEYDFCPKCGKPYNDATKRVKTPRYLIFEEKYIKIAFIVVAIIIVLGIGLFLLTSCEHSSNDNKKENTKTSTTARTSASTTKSTTTNTSNESNTPTNNNTNNNTTEANIGNDLKHNIEYAFESIGYDKTKIKKIMNDSDWSNGPRYKVLYDNELLIVYAFDNNEIASIRDTSLNFLYENKEATGVDESDIKNNDIVLIEGQLGEYGKEEFYNSEKYIRYYVPAGTYTVKALTRHAQFFIEKQAIYTNDFGYQESKIVKNITMGDVNSTETIIIAEDECINLTSRTSISIEKNK